MVKNVQDHRKGPLQQQYTTIQLIVLFNHSHPTQWKHTMLLSRSLALSPALLPCIYVFIQFVTVEIKTNRSVHRSAYLVFLKWMICSFSFFALSLFLCGCSWQTSSDLINAVLYDAARARSIFRICRIYNYIFSTCLTISVVGSRLRMCHGHIIYTHWADKCRDN